MSASVSATYGSAHLPECPQFCDGKPPKCRGGDCTLCDEVDCYCDSLRACEQRLIREGRTRGSGVWHDGYGMGYIAALDAAEQAILELHYPLQNVTTLQWCSECSGFDRLGRRGFKCPGR